MRPEVLIFVPFLAALEFAAGCNVFDRPTPDTRFCDKFYKCYSRENLVALNCPPGTSFDTQRYVCEQKHLVDCGSRTSTVYDETDKQTFVCPEPGVFADSENCQNFYSCGPDYEPHLMSCIASTFFDSSLKVCNHYYAVDCGNRPAPGRPTTTTSQAPSISTSTYGPATTSSTASYSSTNNPTTSTSQMSSTALPSSTTTKSSTSNKYRYPDKVVGMYILLADETVRGFGTRDEWQPRLFNYQRDGSNVLFFTFIHPETMEVPVSFRNLAATRGSSASGSVPADTKIIFAIGGYSYSIDYNPWHWLTSKSAAEAMATKVAGWFDLYNVDGIDLDIEEGAGSRPEAGQNLVHFVRKLRQIRPDAIIGQPTYGYPQVEAEIEVINNSWNVDGSSTDLADSVGLMVYEGEQSLSYTKNYVHGTEQWQGFPIRVNVDKKAVLLGCKGAASGQTIDILADEAKKHDYLGIMVWYASVVNGFQYESSWDASANKDSRDAYVRTMRKFMT